MLYPRAQTSGGGGGGGGGGGAGGGGGGGGRRGGGGGGGVGGGRGGGYPFAPPTPTRRQYGGAMSTSSRHGPLVFPRFSSRSDDVSAPASLVSRAHTHEHAAPRSMQNRQ